MSEKSISERAKETLKWIQKEQKTNGEGMVESANVPDQNALRFLLRTGDVFEPQQGMIKSSAEPESEESGSSWALFLIISLGFGEPPNLKTKTTYLNHTSSYPTPTGRYFQVQLRKLLDLWVLQMTPISMRVIVTVRWLVALCVAR